MANDTLDRMAASVAEHARQADDATMAEGLAWYGERAPREIRRLAKLGGCTFRQAAGVLAAFNSNASWAGSLTMSQRTMAMYAAGRKRTPKVGLPDACRKAWAILYHGERPLDVLGGPKIRSFYRNMTGDGGAVTIDRWAERATGCTEGLKFRSGGYELISLAYREAAAELGWTAAETQAVVWCKIRGGAA